MNKFKNPTHYEQVVKFFKTQFSVIKVAARNQLTELLTFEINLSLAKDSPISSIGFLERTACKRQEALKRF